MSKISLYLTRFLKYEPLNTILNNNIFNHKYLSFYDTGLNHRIYFHLIQYYLNPENPIDP